MRNADLIFISVPVGSFGKVVEEMSKFLKKGVIITDTGSTKVSVIKDVTPFIKNDVFFLRPWLFSF